MSALFFVFFLISVLKSFILIGDKYITIYFLVIIGMLHSLIGFLSDIFCCRFKLGKYGKHTHKDVYSGNPNSPTSLTSPLSSEQSLLSPPFTSPQPTTPSLLRNDSVESYTSQTLQSPSDHQNPTTSWGHLLL